MLTSKTIITISFLMYCINGEYPEKCTLGVSSFFQLDIPNETCEIKKSSSQTQNSLKKHVDPIVACSFGLGQLGNQMSSFSTIYSFEKDRGNVLAYIKRFQMNMFKIYFQCNGPIQPRILEDDFPEWSSKGWVEPFPMSNFSDQSVWSTVKSGTFLNVGLYPNNPKTFKHYLSELKSFFTPKKLFLDEAQRRLQEVVKMYKATTGFNGNNSEITFVSIHVRRTDYSVYLREFFGMKYVSGKYFIKAMKYFEDKFKNLVFFVVSDDPEWVQTKLENVSNNIFYIGSKAFRKLKSKDHQIGVDLALLSQSNHSIMTYGTFGMWGSIMSGGISLLPKSHIKATTSEQIVEANFQNWFFI